MTRRCDWLGGLAVLASAAVIGVLAAVLVPLLVVAGWHDGGERARSVR
mgnify:CR=1 FL=1